VLPISHEGGVANETGTADNVLIRIPWNKRPAKAPRGILPSSASSDRVDKRPIRAESRLTLVQAISRGRQWLDELVAGAVTSTQEIAERETVSLRQVNMTISLAFLSPALVRAAVDGRLPRGVGVATLRDAPAAWSMQHAMLGLAP
jgi:hypothetical protein